MHDASRDIFFIPGGNGGYILTYKGGTLDLVKAIEGSGIQRALYIGQSLYILGTEQMSVWNMNTWGKLGELRW
jgi:uncharacterized secreted protein with C-terminal beta-propeller domain